MKEGFMKNVMGIILLLIVVAGGAYYLGVMNSSDGEEEKVSTSPSPTEVVLATTAPIPTSTPIATATPSPSWKVFMNSKSGLSIKYPATLAVKEMEFSTAFTFEPYPTSGQGPLEFIEIAYIKDFPAFDPLFKANTGDNVIAAHNAIDVKVAKLKNFKIGKFDAVEYIRDGITPPKSGLGRGPIGYEHNIVVKKDVADFIRFTNTTMDVEKTKRRDEIFNVMMSTLEFK